MTNREAGQALDRQALPFVLRRNKDLSGVSGTGIVAEGVEFSDGTVALRWLSAWPTSVVFHERGIEAVRAVHGHDGATEIVWACVCCRAFDAERDAFCAQCAALTGTERAWPIIEEEVQRLRAERDRLEQQTAEARRIVQTELTRPDSHWSHLLGALEAVQRILGVPDDETEVPA